MYRVGIGLMILALLLAVVAMPAIAVFLIPVAPVLLVFYWGASVLLTLRDIRDELRALRSERHGIVPPPEATPRR